MDDKYQIMNIEDCKIFPIFILFILDYQRNDDNLIKNQYI